MAPGAAARPAGRAAAGCCLALLLLNCAVPLVMGGGDMMRRGRGMQCMVPTACSHAPRAALLHPSSLPFLVRPPARLPPAGILSMHLTAGWPYCTLCSCNGACRRVISQHP